MALRGTMIVLGVLFVLGTSEIAASAPESGPDPGNFVSRGHAEDHFSILSLRARVSVPFMTSSRALLTKEWTPLEPGTLDHKYYVRRIGQVKEVTVKGPLERSELVSVQRP